MSIECGICERDLRGGHAADCPLANGARRSDYERAFNDERVNTMQRLMWDTFSARYNNASRHELELFPKLKAAWDEWQIAWYAGIEAHTSTYTEAGR